MSGVLRGAVAVFGPYGAMRKCKNKPIKRRKMNDFLYPSSSRMESDREYRHGVFVGCHPDVSEAQRKDLESLKSFGLSFRHRD
jgi:hypothetical protein